MNRRDFQDDNRHPTFGTRLVLLTGVPQRSVAGLHRHPRSVVAGDPAGSLGDAEELGGRRWMAPEMTTRFKGEECQGTISAEPDPAETARTIAPKSIDLASGIRTRMEDSHPVKPYTVRSVSARRLRSRGSLRAGRSTAELPQLVNRDGLGGRASPAITLFGEDPGSRKCSLQRVARRCLGGR